MAAEPFDKADVYYNLHRKLWSLRCRKTGLVMRHARVVVAAFGGVMVVQEAGRQRTIREKQKCIHAFARIDHGDTDRTERLDDWQRFAIGLPGAMLITYNPYRAGHFYRKDTGAPIDRVSTLVMLAPEDGPPKVFATV